MMDILDSTAIELNLDIENYPGKWKQAKLLALKENKRDYAEETAFHLACRLFLELGGDYIKKEIKI